jgi:uncharacterized protein YbbC (DUF1343 family)
MILLGVEALAQQHYAPLRGRRVGLYTNLATVDDELMPTYLRFANTREVNLVALFAPEHGLASAQAEAEKVSTQVEDTSNVPVFSLYGERFRPLQEMVANLDVVVCDIQDVGVRYYTFLWTLTHIMDACGEYGVPVVVCDRPNPLGGNVVQGGPVQPGYDSFVGRYNIPIRHGMTIGELALMINATFNPHRCELTVVPCQGYDRRMTFADLGRPWVPTSPNIAHFAGAQHYTGSCLVEGTTLSEGRGTALPFEIVGAPSINGPVVADYLNMQRLPGVRFRPHGFRPSSGKFAGVMCSGVQAHIYDFAAYNPLLTWLTVLRELRTIYPEQFAWLPPFEGRYHIDLLAGSDAVRTMIDASCTVAEITAGWDDYCRAFRRARAPYLLYPETP